jgi:spore maturation protein CgeB
MKLLFHGPLWPGSTSLQRVEAFRRMPGLTLIAHDTGARVHGAANLYRRIRWRLRWPVDEFDENARLLRIAETTRPDVIFIDNSRVVSLRTLRRLRDFGDPTLAYYTPDDIIAPHNLSWPLRLTFPEWDIFFTTKTFNLPELASRNVRRPVLIGKAFDTTLHRPMTKEEVGPEYQKYDLVFLGAFERDRAASIRRLGEAGLNVLVFTSATNKWQLTAGHSNVVIREAVFNVEYTKAIHYGKIALCFLRKINRDRITQRTMEIAATGQPMLAEKTDEHDIHFIDGREYVGFTDDSSLVRLAKGLLENHKLRSAIGDGGRNRCLSSGYSTADRATQLLEAIVTARQARDT